MIYNVVLCGGVGSRLWPLSRKSFPKQYLKLFGDKSLFQLTIQRNANYVDGLITVGNQLNNELATKQLDEIGEVVSIAIVESIARNTAPAIAFAAFALEDEDVIFVTPSDHLIDDNDDYSIAVNKAIDLAKSGNIVTFGIKPNKPETGFGYIHFNDNDVLAFVEKPNIETAKTFLESGQYLWNSGMFCFKVSSFLNEFKKHAPTMYEESLLAFKNSTNGIMPLAECEKINGNSIDYTIMEKTDKAKVVPANINWSDLGSFSALWDYYELNNPEKFINGNLVINPVKHFEIEGLNNLIIVNTEDAFLIIPREKAQDVKNVYNRIENSHTALL